jgi:hypothetical protein
MENIREKLSAIILNEDIDGKNMRSVCSSYSMFREWFYQPRTTNEASFEISKLTQNTMDEAFGKVQNKLKAFENRVLYPYFLEMRECLNSKLSKKKIKKEEAQKKTDEIIKQDSMNEEDEPKEPKKKSSGFPEDWNKRTSCGCGAKWTEKRTDCPKCRRAFNEETDEELDVDKVKELSLSKKPLTRFKQLLQRKKDKKA